MHAAHAAPVREAEDEPPTPRNQRQPGYDAARARELAARRAMAQREAFIAARAREQALREREHEVQRRRELQAVRASLRRWHDASAACASAIVAWRRRTLGGGLVRARVEEHIEEQRAAAPGNQNPKGHYRQTDPRHPRQTTAIEGGGAHVHGTSFKHLHRAI